jgi:signal transduction histidine kinase
MRARRAVASVPCVARSARSTIRIRRLLGSEGIDLVLAGLVALLSVALLVGGRHSLPAVVLGVLGSASIAARRRAPVVSVVWIIAATALIAIIGDGASGQAQGLAAALCFYTLAGRGSPRTSVDVALLLAAAGVVALTPHVGLLGYVVPWLLFVALPYLAGRAVVTRRRLTRELEINAGRAHREQEARAGAAALEERTRIAREIHDVLAHSLSVMVIQTVAAREIAAGDPASARAALAAVQLSGREALLEMRRMIGVLRRGDVALAGSTTPGLSALERLAEQTRMSGLPVELRVVGERRELPGALDLVAFRIVQEALTNAIKHAGPARASVTVTFAADVLDLEICDDGRGRSSETATAGAGHGLVGMRERIALIGGELSAGRRRGGGFRVHARFPIEEALVT